MELNSNEAIWDSWAITAVEAARNCPYDHGCVEDTIVQREII